MDKDKDSNIKKYVRKPNHRISVWLGFGMGIGFCTFIMSLINLFEGGFTTYQNLVLCSLGIIIMGVYGYSISGKLEKIT